MLGNKFAAFIRVNPKPTTLAETSAIVKHLKSYGRVTTFVEDQTGDKRAVPGTLCFYTEIGNESRKLSSLTQFDVPVHHNLPNPRNEDPFDIRGLQHRKPWLGPRTFRCTVVQADTVEEARMKKVQEDTNPYRGAFTTSKDDFLPQVLRELKAPPRITKGLGRLVTSQGEHTSSIKAANTATRAGKHDKEKNHAEKSYAYLGDARRASSARAVAANRSIVHFTIPKKSVKEQAMMAKHRFTTRKLSKKSVDKTDKSPEDGQRPDGSQ